jgi:polysaccharide deacetylase 2 family uncharacterized protein YibQ
MADELSAPLGRRKRRKAMPAAGAGLARLLPRGGLPLARIGFSLAALIVVAAGLRILLVSDPEGGRPSTTVAINSTRDANTVAGAVAAPAKAPVTITVAPEVPAGASVTTVDPTLPGGTPPGAAQPSRDGIIAELAEPTKNGPIPRISASGETPFSAYARPAPPPSGKPMVAVVMTGLGLDEAGTLDAIDKLPPDIDLAFAPYGKTLARTVAAARNAGHELLLQIPMEPFDYPETDPGPQTLLTGQPPRANLDKLYWLMARFGGYVGLVNNTGARFTASSADFGPVMEELGTRGLGYLDDGTSNRSVAAELAQTDKVPFGKADLMLDADPSRAAILAALDQLAAKAASQGFAIGVVSALPVSIATLAEWSSTLPTRNLELVPASTLMK